MRNVLLIFFIFFTGSLAFSDQDMNLNYKEIDNIEAVLETNFPQLEKSAPSESEVSIPQSAKQKTDFSDVESSALYSDLAVFQKSYMPKSKRVQLTSGIVMVPTDVFYLTGGLSLKAAYHFTESWGLEVFTNLLGSSARQEVDNIASKQNVSVKNLVSLKSFSGANVYYNFIYGKLSLLDFKVVPFEIFNTLGVGTMMNSQDFQSSSVQVGIGSLFSLTRSSAIRLDLSWAFYQTKNILDKTVNENSTFLSLGYSWFFPEPQYR